MTKNIFLTIGLIALAWGSVETARGAPPGQGFVTGGGWIVSQPGAYIADTNLAGNAYFGFASSYKKGAAVPTGNTEFLFEVGNMNFRSSSYDWLVITAGSARFKGSGTINGDALSPDGSEYKFMIWAEDEPDSFRIRIWAEDDVGGEVDVYDNDGSTEIGGGSIVIHTGN